MGISDYVEAFDSAWPVDAGPSHSRHVSFSLVGRDCHQVRHDGTGLPAPFHRGFRMSLLDGDRNHGAIDAETVLAVIRRTADLSRQIMGASDLVHGMAARYGMKAHVLRPWEVYHRAVGGGREIVVECRVNVDALNHAGRSVREAFVVGIGLAGNAGFDDLDRLGRAQDERRKISGRSLRADRIMAQALLDMTDDGRRRLLEHLYTHPQSTGSEAGATAPNWTKASLRPYRVPLPPAVDKIYVRNGVIVGRVRLGPRTTWSTGTLKHVGEGAPETLLGSAAGRPLREIIDHPDIGPDMIVERAAMGGYRHYISLRIKTKYDLIEVF